MSVSGSAGIDDVVIPAVTCPYERTSGLIHLRHSLDEPLTSSTHQFKMLRIRLWGTYERFMGGIPPFGGASPTVADVQIQFATRGVVAKPVADASPGRTSNDRLGMAPPTESSPSVLRQSSGSTTTLRDRSGTCWSMDANGGRIAAAFASLEQAFLNVVRVVSLQGQIKTDLVRIVRGMPCPTDHTCP